MDKQIVVAEEHDPTVHHEETDVNVRAILFWVVVFLVSAAVIHFTVWFLWSAFKKMERSKDDISISHVAGHESSQIPPAPHLQPFPEPAQNGGGGGRKSVGGGAATELTGDVSTQDPWKATPATDMEELKAHYDKELSGYGWVDRNRGIVHVPIELAKQRLLQEGLPVRTAMPADASTAAPQAAAPAASPATTQPTTSSTTVSHP